MDDIPTCNSSLKMSEFLQSIGNTKKRLTVSTTEEEEPFSKKAMS